MLKTLTAPAIVLAGGAFCALLIPGLAAYIVSIGWVILVAISLPLEYGGVNYE